MNTLLTEWYKVRGYRPFWILAGIAAAIYLLASTVISKLMELKSDVPIPDIQIYPQVWETQSYIARWMLYFLGFCVIQLVGNERDFRTDRQNIIDGMSRTQYFFAKWINSLIPLAIAMVLIVGSTLMFGRGTFSSDLRPLAHFALCALGYGALALLTGLIFRKSTTAAFVFVAYPIALEPLAGMVLDYYLETDVSKYFPFQVLSGLILSPFAGIQEQLGMEFLPMHILRGLSAAYVAMMYLAAFVFVQRRNY